MSDAEEIDLLRAENEALASALSVTILIIRDALKRVEALRSGAATRGHAAPSRPGRSVDSHTVRPGLNNGCGND